MAINAYWSPLYACLLGLGMRLFHLRQALPRVLIAALMFILTAGPYVVALSTAKGRPTFGDSGRLAYVWYVNKTTQMADALRHRGIAPGDKLASIGHANDPPLGWARLARVKIVAEIYSTAVSPVDIKPGVEKDFWAADEAVRHQAIAAFANAGAKAVVVWDPPPWAPMHGWQPVGDTGYYVYFLPPSVSPAHLGCLY
jgi:hypothetical protein